MSISKFSTLLFLALGLFFLSPTETYGEDLDNNDIFGARALSVFEQEVHSNILPVLCAKGPEADIAQCLKNKGRTLKTNQREFYFAIPGNQLKDGFFNKFEREAFESIDFETELKKTPAGRQLAERIARSRANGKNIAVNIFYHSERKSSERAIALPLLHYGFTVSDSQRALVGLNAFQSQTDAFYTLAHEFYHLFDSEIKEEDPSSIDEMYQEIRAILFELRLYAERQMILHSGKYTYSKFHEAYIVKEDNQISIDIGKVIYESFNAHHPDRMPGQYVFDPKRGSYVLTISPSGESTLTELENDKLILPLRNALLSIFDKHINKTDVKRGDTSILARLLYYLPNDKIDINALKKRADSIRSISRGNAVNIINDYGHLLDFRYEITLRREGFNKIIDGGPKPRNGGGP